MSRENKDYAHPELVSGGVTEKHSHPGGGNGVVTYYAEDEEQSETTSTYWQTKVTYTVVVAGDYLVSWSFELSQENIAYHCLSQVLHNTTEIANMQFEPEDVSPAFWLSGAGFKKLTLAVDDTIKINWRAEAGEKLAHIRRARIFLLKV